MNTTSLILGFTFYIAQAEREAREVIEALAADGIEYNCARYEITGNRGDIAIGYFIEVEADLNGNEYMVMGLESYKRGLVEGYWRQY